MDNEWLEAGKLRWFAAMRWRRAVANALREGGLTFTQWLVLSAVRDVIAATEVPASQIEVARHLELDTSTVSAVMTALANRGLVDRGMDASTTAWRVLVTQRGAAVLEQSERLLAAPRRSA